MKRLPLWGREEMGPEVGGIKNNNQKIKNDNRNDSPVDFPSKRTQNNNIEPACRLAGKEQGIKNIDRIDEPSDYPPQ